ncbi:tripartite ATP-independent periplasmic transporter DctQ component [Clostridium aceticum]|uniref:Tripartite ATP-independent periplasmic transporter DctQ component n=1 Tax=Clostridium aceticum TaxID=84022 RepID=A0A0G3W9Q7_9CLOT|nr:TRAP transporter small permease [Clostridium aceticum]AKL94585.1 tripartite ATP-independent periplasmic transporter DctQ component [Clostridium aceticum]
MKNILEKIINFYNKAEEYILVVSLAFTVILVFIQVVMRYIFNQSLSWSEELCRYIFVWQVWLGASLGFRTNNHIAIEMIYDKLKGKSKIIYSLVSNSITLAFNIFLVRYGFQLVETMITRGTVSSGMRMPLYIVYLSVPVSSLAIVFRIIGKMYNDAKGFIPIKSEGSKV